MRRLTWAVCALLLSAACAGRTAPSIYTDSHPELALRLTVAIVTDGYYPVCGGVIVGPRHVMTVEHCLRGGDAVPYVTLEQWRNNWPPVDTATRRQCVRVPPNPAWGGDRGDGVCLLETVQPFSEWARVAPVRPGLEYSLLAVHHPAGRWWRIDDGIGHRVGSGVDSTISACPGSSGGPLWHGDYVAALIRGGRLRDGEMCGTVWALAADLAAELLPMGGHVDEPAGQGGAGDERDTD